jgi:hypothetical protein
MGNSRAVKIVALAEEVPALVLETAWFPGAEPQQHKVGLLVAEVASFRRVLALQPFGVGPHQFSVESLSEVGGAYACTIRISKERSRGREQLPISDKTHEQLSSVFGSNIISAGYVRT